MTPRSSRSARGRPGRGQGGAKPSSAASRSLASGSRSRRLPSYAAGAGAEPDQDLPTDAEVVALGVESEQPAEPAAPTETSAAQPPAPRPPCARRAGAARRCAVADLLSAFHWRRASCSATMGAPSSPGSWPSCGAASPVDYVVDEYGFDQEVTERFFLAALRPIAQKWFASRCAAPTTSPPQAARWWSPTTPARSPSTV